MPPQAGAGGLVFGPVPAGFRDFGSTLVGRPGEGEFIGAFASADSFTELERAFTAAHSKAAIEARKVPYVVKPSDCIGSGENTGQALVVQNLPHVADEVRAGIACAELRHPEAMWMAVRLIGSDSPKRYLSVIAFMDKKFRHIEMYADVSRFVQSVPATSP